MDKSIYDDENLLFAALLREARVEAKLSQQDLAEKLGTYKSMVSRFELGERRLDIVEIRQICKALGQDFVKFIKYYNEECADLPRSLVRDKRVRYRIKSDPHAG